MKNFLKTIIPTKVFAFIRDIFYPEKIHILEDRLNNLFFSQYQSLAAPVLDQKIAFKNAEFKIYSKHGCDGMLAHIFSKISPTNRTFVEIGVENGRECNTANLSRNFGWHGLLLDANKEWIKSAEAFYKGYDVRVAAGFVTAENINQLLRENQFKGEIDLLSIDIDSNDYWVWQALDAVNPRVVVIEYNSAFGLKSITMKYDPEFHFQKVYKDNPLYYGASLAALTKLGQKKGYTLVACDSHGHDAYFVRSEVAKGKFAALTPEKAFYPNPFTIKKFGSIEEQFKQVEHLNFVAV